MVQKQADFIRAKVHLHRLFTPGSPISSKDSLAGRLKEVNQILEAVSTTGRHAIIFGERGVGKTSLANLVHQLWEDFSKDLGFVAPRVNCEPLDDFATIWANIAEELETACQERGMNMGPISKHLARLRNGEASPNLIRRTFQDWSLLVIPIVDEFDRLQDPDTIQRFADTIKALSDHSVETTLVIVGVAETIDELIQDHASVDRPLVQILLRRLDSNDISDIVLSRLSQVGMAIDEPAITYIARLSQGLPYYAHLIGKTSAFAALDAGRMQVRFVDVITGLGVALDNASEAVKGAYYHATTSARSVFYRAVLLACALAETDDRGYFSPADIRRPLFQVTTVEHEIGKYLPHLTEFCSQSRGRILQKSGARWKQRYRFTDPLMKPFVILQAVETGLLDPDQM